MYAVSSMCLGVVVVLGSARVSVCVLKMDRCKLPKLPGKQEKEKEWEDEEEGEDDGNTSYKMYSL